jgi:hypothetical protein
MFLTFGLAAIPLSLIWMIFYFPMMGLSWIYNKAPFLRVPVGILGMPLSFLAYVYVNCISHMGEERQKVIKMFICISWPYCIDAQRFIDGKYLGELEYERIFDLAYENDMHEILHDIDYDNRRI